MNISISKILLRIAATLIVLYLLFALLAPGGSWQIYLAIAAAIVLLSPLFLQLWISWKNMNESSMDPSPSIEAIYNVKVEEKSLQEANLSDEEDEKKDLPSQLGKAMPRLLIISALLLFLGWWWDLLLYYGIVAAFNLILLIYLAIRKMSYQRDFLK
ncbi:hypothetical protein [Heliorestis convoluta]|uniref:Putative membrane protein n=1 Tax=Heliorestis convoluta TaxID=356322 RepID=A0A5Q2N5M3_9FIRM|nr:hypothetical protein [Heliorestis convoluta]QGG47875.1 putative membrane protein [Heliorestis convoluta]